MKKTFLTVYFILTLGSGCGPVQGYAGPEQPEDEVAFLYFKPSLDVNLREMMVDDIGVTAWDSGVALLPGPHIVSLRGVVRETLCPVPGDERCPSWSVPVFCRIRLHLEEDTEYEVELRGSARHPTVRVLQAESRQTVASGRCKSR